MAPRSRFGQGQSGESPLEVVASALATILAVPRAQVPLRHGQLLRDLNRQELDALNRQLDRRLPRVVDPLTSQVRFELRGPAISFDPREARDPTFARQARLYLDDVRQLLSEVDPWRCRPTACPEDIRDTLAHITRDLDLLATEFAGDPTPLIVDGAFVELLGPDDIPEGTAGTGLLEELRTQLEDATPNRVDEQQVELVIAAAAVTETLQELWEDVRDDPVTDLEDMFLIVERCASGIAEQTVVVRTMLAEYGIGRCDLDRPLEIPNPDPGKGHKPDPSATTFGAFLNATEREPPRWQQLAQLGGGVQQRSIQEAAGRLAAEAEKLKPDQMLKALGLPIHDGQGDSSELIALRRLKELVIAFAARIGASSGSGRGRTGGGGGGSGGGSGAGGSSTGTAKSTSAAESTAKATTASRSAHRNGVNGHASGPQDTGAAGPARIPPSEAHHLEMP